MPRFIVQRSAYDASRPWIVLCTFRSFNRVFGHYAERGEALRRVRDLIKSGR